MIGIIIKAILSGLWKPILKVLAVFGAYGKGRVDQASREKLKDLKAKDATRERIDDAEIVGNDPDAARRWLKEREKP